MNNICLKIAVVMIANIGLFASSANASITIYGCADADTCTLQELFDGGYFDVDDLRFSNWSFVSSSYTTPEAPDPSLIDVEIYDAAYLDFAWGLPGEGPGFRAFDETSIYGAERRRLVSLVNESGKQVFYQYDEDGQLVAEKNSDGEPVERNISVSAPTEGK